MHEDNGKEDDRVDSEVNPEPKQTITQPLFGPFANIDLFVDAIIKNHIAVGIEYKLPRPEH